MENGKKLIHSFNSTDYSQGHFEGLTKREYFAGLAMQGILANETVRSILSGNNGMQVPNLIAEYSLQYADELLKQLDK
jgi:hypothetical protein